MEYNGLMFISVGIISLTMGYLAFTRPESIFAKITITIFKIDHRIKGALAIIIGIISMIIGILYYI